MKRKEAAVIYKITGKTESGRGQCGHRTKAGETYFIVRFGRELHAKCMNCVGRLLVVKTIRIPTGLKDGIIPIE